MPWLTAEEALQALKTKPQTLYANVSRGRIRAKPDPGDPRRSLYQAADVQRLAERHAGRRKAETVAAETIRWGDPVLASAISTIIAGRLFYRGTGMPPISPRQRRWSRRPALLWNGTETLFSGTVAGNGPAVAFRLRSWRWPGRGDGRICHRSAVSQSRPGGARAHGVLSSIADAVAARGLQTSRCICGWRRAGSGRMPPIACAAPWYCLPITNSTRRHLRRGSPPRRVPHCRLRCSPVWRH